MAVLCVNCENTILCKNKEHERKYFPCRTPLGGCSDDHACSKVCCSNCYEKLKRESDIARDKIANQEKENAMLKEDVAFLSKWSFVPGEASSASDITICTSDGSKFYAHTLLLANRSDVFRAMFEVDLKEKRTGQALIEDVGGEIFGVFLKYLYTAQLSDKDTVAHYKELVKLAHLYQVKLLLQKLDMFIVEHVLKKETAIELLKMMHTYELEKSEKAAHKMIAGDSELVNIILKEFSRIV